MAGLCGCASARAYSPVPAAPAALLPGELSCVAVAPHRPRSFVVALEPQGIALRQSCTAATRNIPYRYLLAAIPDSEAGTLTLSALVPTKHSDPRSKLKLWHFDARVTDIGAERDTSTDEATKDSALDTWCAEAERRAYAGVNRTRRLHCIVNPAGGKGKAKATWLDVVKPVFDAARASYHVSYTGAPSSSTNARALGLAHDPSAYDALVAFSGDGIVHELLNGLAGQPQGARALRETPIVHVPCGSGNALATSIYGPERVGDVRWAALAALKGTPMPLDLSSLSQLGEPRLYTFLTQAFGLMADLDLGTEHLRWMGDLRFTLGYIQGALKRRAYPCTLDVRVAHSSKARIARAHNAALGGAGQREGEGEQGPDEMPPLALGDADAPLPEARIRLDRLPREGELELDKDGEQWVSLDLSRDGVFFAYAGKVPFVSKDVMLFPAADPEDGLLDLVLVAPMSPLAALTAMDNAATGGLLALPSVTYLKCSAYRLSFPPAAAQGKEGHVSVDGERVPYKPFQVEVHRGLARVMGFDGVWEGRKRIEGFEARVGEGEGWRGK